MNQQIQNCSKLGSQLHFEKPLDKFIDKATWIIAKDFNISTTYLKGKPIYAYSNNNNEYAFSHILKLDEKNISEKKKKIRAKIAPQIKKLIELINNDSCCKELLIWKHRDSKSKKNKLHILCKQTRLMIVLSITNKSYFLTTAYFVDDIDAYLYYLNQYKWSEKGI